ncbi:hypothetical protein WA1_01305 [Scytonema hofmannii PCC 7110]|uniref:ParB/Sulfiredoxin domain-containing protein n=1 Tax=Scytonema hofmannii PCC 7110 TaxID=128403 RepID=A0A139XGN7_9CYAN|nr:hypothetical protein [Scytonema hofmannii]KYC43823.1 hypothetical protein WA1_01305 [Scytonema hofmannii PCC 7110]
MNYKYRLADNSSAEHRSVHSFFVDDSWIYGESPTTSATIARKVFESRQSYWILKIDPEFKNLIPPLSFEEKLQLEANLQEFGCLDPLIVWKGTSILLDGHNRYEICTRLQMHYETVEIDLPSKDAAICWIANHQLGRRNVTPETASYLRGKRYLHLKGNKENNLKQNLPKGHFDPSEEEPQKKNPPKDKSFLSKEEPENVNLPKGHFDPSESTAKTLAEQHKVGERTIKRDAQFTTALDIIAQVLGEDLKHSILTRTAGLTKKDTLSLARIVRDEGKEAAQLFLKNKRNSLDITQQIKNKQRVPNPRRVGEICQIVAQGDPELKKFSKCWGIIKEVNLHSCYIQTWKMDFPTVKPENLEPVYVKCEVRAAQNCHRIRQLSDKIYKEYELTHVAVVEALARISDPSNLTAKQERMLAFLEQEYGL